MSIAKQSDARKSPLKDSDIDALLAQVTQIYATKGKQVVHVDLKKQKPDMETLRPLLIGPTGNLRAPTLRKGKALIVGFDEATYRKMFG